MSYEYDKLKGQLDELATTIQKPNELTEKISIPEISNYVYTMSLGIWKNKLPNPVIEGIDENGVITINNPKNKDIWQEEKNTYHFDTIQIYLNINGIDYGDPDPNIYDGTFNIKYGQINNYENKQIKIDIQPLLKNGKNIILLKCKTSISYYHYIDTEYNYVFPSTYIKIIDEQRTYGWTRSALAKLGDEIYILGGSLFGTNVSGSKVVEIFNVIEQKCHVAEYQLASNFLNGAYGIYNNIVYMIGSYLHNNKYSSEIKTFNLETKESLIINENSIVPKIYLSFFAQINEKLYIGYYDQSIYVFNMADESIVKLDVVFPVKMSSSNAIAIDNYIYIFGGIINGSSTNKWWKFNVETLEINEMSNLMLVQRAYMSLMKIDNLIYLMGGTYYGNGNQDIQIFDLTTETFSYSTKKLPFKIQCANFYQIDSHTGYMLGFINKQAGDSRIIEFKL